MTTVVAPLDFVFDNPFQTRRDYGDVADFARDIMVRGLMQVPVGRLLSLDGVALTGDELWDAVGRIRLERRFPDNLRVQLAYGHRRLRAMRALSKRSMPVKIHDLNDEAMLDMLWSENEQRANPNPMEQAELLAAKVARAVAAGGTVQTVADTWGLSRPTVSNKMRLLKLPADVQAAVREGRVSERQAMGLLSSLGEPGPGDEAQRLVETVLSAPAAISSDAIRKRTPPARRATSKLRHADPVPMFRFMLPNDQPDAIMRTWAEIERAARSTCERCIMLLGPSSTKVCRECPAVMVMMELTRRAGDGPADGEE